MQNQILSEEPYNKSKTSYQNVENVVNSHVESFPWERSHFPLRTFFSQRSFFTVFTSQNSFDMLKNQVLNYRSQNSFVVYFSL